MRLNFFDILKYSRLMLIALIMAFIFTAFNKYLYLAKSFPLSPFLYVALLLAVVLVSSPKTALRAIFHAGPLMWWLVFFLIVSMGWIIVAGHEDYAYAEFKSRLVIMTLMVAGIILASNQGVGLYIKLAVFSAFVISCINGFIEFNSPFFFLPPDSQFSNPGRSSGFFMNANRAATFISLLMYAAVILAPQRWRLVLVSIGSLSVLITWSRGGIACHALLVLMLPLVGLISWRQFGFLVGGASFLLANLALIFTLMPGRDVGVNVDNIYNRAAFFLGENVYVDASVSERLDVAGKSFEYFGASPLLGHGTGFAVGWGELVSPHNQNLFFMVDHGLLGALIYPLFLVALYYSALTQDRKFVLALIVFLFCRGMFTHNILDEQGVVLVSILISLLGRYFSSERGAI